MRDNIQFTSSPRRLFQETSCMSPISPPSPQEQLHFDPHLSMHFYVLRSEASSASGFYGRRLTFDHRAEDEGEMERIKSAGGFITRGR